MPRLVYADWLEEHGGEVACDCSNGAVTYYKGPGATNLAFRDCDRCGGTGRVPDSNAARAEFIRVQCELAKEYPGVYEECVCRAVEDKFHCNHCLDMERSDALRQREQELLKFGQRHTSTDHDLRMWEWFNRDLLGPGKSDNRVKVVPRRGFVGEFILSLEAFMGKACETCSGVGKVFADDAPLSETCRTCKGVGRVGSVAADLRDRQPVERVELTDREPQDYRGSDVDLFGWWRLTEGVMHDPNGTRPCDLPPELWDEVAKQPGRIDHGSWADFPTRADALDALTAACVAYCRAMPVSV